MDVQRSLRTTFSIGLSLNVFLTVYAQSHVQLPALDVHAHSFRGHSGSIIDNRQIPGDTHNIISRTVYITGLSPSQYSGGYGGVHWPKKKERVSWRKFLGDKINTVMGGRTSARKKKTWKQIVQENLVENGIQNYLSWDKCNAVLLNVLTIFLRNSRFLELAVDNFCADKLHKLLSPILDPFTDPVYAGIERRVGPEASKKPQGHGSHRG